MLTTDDGQVHELPIADISATGMLVSTETALPLGTTVKLAFRLPKQQHKVEIEATVARKVSKEGPAHKQQMIGIGIRFDRFHGDAKTRVEAYVAEDPTQKTKMVYYL